MTSRPVKVAAHGARAREFNVVVYDAVAHDSVVCDAVV